MSQRAQKLKKCLNNHMEIDSEKSQGIKYFKMQYSFSFICYQLDYYIHQVSVNNKGFASTVGLVLSGKYAALLDK